MKMNLKKSILRATAIAAALISPMFFTGQAGAASTPYPMASGNYSENFSDMVSWPAGLGGTSTTASNWSPVAVNSSGTIPDGQKITTSTATFSSGTSGGLQTNSPVGSMTFLATGSTDNTSAVAVDLLLDFTGRNAGALSFNWTEVNNSTGNRCGSVRVYTSTDGSTWTELTGAAVLNVVNNVAASGSITSVALPAGFNGSSTARIRFYYYNGTGGTTGSRPKIAIDNVAVTSTAPAGNPPVITGISPSSIAANAGDTAAFTVTATGDAASYYWYKETGSSTNLISSATTATLTLANVLAADIANYQVALSNASGMATSAVVSLTVVDPAIIIQPSSQTKLLNSTVSFTVSANGTPTMGYKWFTGTLGSNTPLSNGGRISGTDTSTLTITNLANSDNAASYFVVITNVYSSATSSVVTLTVANTAPLVYWDFNGSLNVTSPTPAQGVGTAVLVGTVSGFSNSVASANDPDMVEVNNAWGTDGYPASGVGNKTSGVRFNVSTSGAKNINVSYDTRGTSTASKYERLQYTTNGTDFIDYPTGSSFSTTLYESRAFSLVGFPGVQNNPNFGIRIVIETEGSASNGATNSPNYVGISSTYATSGTVSYDIVNITGDAITNNNLPPTISSFTNVVTTDTAAATVLNFTVGDDSTAADSLLVSAVSLNQTVMPNGQLVLGGSGASRTLSLLPVLNGLGVAPIQVTVTDGNGDSTTTWFYVTVNPGNQPPTISGLASTNMLGNITSTFAFTVGDDQTPAGSLTLTAFSGNTTLVSNDTSHISFGGSGASRTIIIAPVPNQYGVAPITVTVNDGQKNTSVSFSLVVRPHLNIVLNDYFDYDGSGAIINQSGGFWQTHSGTAGQMQVGSGQVTVTDGNSEDVNAPLIGQPYNPTNNQGFNNQVLYSSFTLNYSALPTDGGTYFAHFKDSSTSGFYDRVYASTHNAASGSYRIGVGNYSGVTNTTAQIAQDLVLNSNYTVVTRLVLSNGFSTIWINPANESSPGMTDTTPVGSLGIIAAYALRENVGEGTMTIANLKVGLSFAALTGVPDPIPLNIQQSGTNVVLTCADPSFSLQSAPAVTGTYTNIPGVTTPFTNSANSTAKFYRLKF